MRRCCSPPWWPRPPGCRRGCVARWRVAWRPQRWQGAENACGVPWPRARAMATFPALSPGILGNIVATTLSAENPPSAKPPPRQAPGKTASTLITARRLDRKGLSGVGGLQWPTPPYVDGRNSAQCRTRPQRNDATRLQHGKARLPAAHPGFTALRPELEGLASVLPLFALQRLDREGVPVFVGHQPQSR